MEVNDPPSGLRLHPAFGGASLRASLESRRSGIETCRCGRARTSRRIIDEWSVFVNNVD